MRYFKVGGRISATDAAAVAEVAVATARQQPVLLAVTTLMQIINVHVYAVNGSSCFLRKQN